MLSASSHVFHWPVVDQHQVLIRFCIGQPQNLDQVTSQTCPNYNWVMQLMVESISAYFTNQSRFIRKMPHLAFCQGEKMTALAKGQRLAGDIIKENATGYCDRVISREDANIVIWWKPRRCVGKCSLNYFPLTASKLPQLINKSLMHHSMDWISSG